MVSALLLFSFNIKRKIVTISFIFLLFFTYALKERQDYYFPVQGTPPADIKFSYNYHKVVAGFDSNDQFQLQIYVWLTNNDNENEILYVFPKEGNEGLKRDLDKMRGSRERGLTVPQGFYVNLGKDGGDNRLRTLDGYNNIAGERQDNLNFIKEQ